MKPRTKGAIERFLPSRMSFRGAGERTYVRKPLRSKLNWFPTIPSVMKKMKVKPPEAISGHISSGGNSRRLKNIPPKTNNMMIGDNSINFASGARIMARRLAIVTTEACSESPAIRFSMNAAPYLPDLAGDWVGVLALAAGIAAQGGEGRE